MKPERPTFIPGMARDILARKMSEFPEGKSNPEPLKSAAKEARIPASILVDKNIPYGKNEPEVHRHQADLWIMIDGKVSFKVGGSLVEPYAKKNADDTVDDREIKGKDILDGEIFELLPQDILYIPEGQPHMHWNPENNAARLWIIKIDAKTEFPLESVPGWKP